MKWKYLSIIPIALLILGYVFYPDSKPITEPVVVAPQLVEEVPVEVVTVSTGGIVDLVNKYRVKNNLEPLTVIPELESSAKEKCQDLIGIPDENGIVQTDFEHTNSDTGVAGLDFAQKDYPYATRWGENLANGLWNTSEQFVSAWLASPSHKEQIDYAYKYTGVAICTGGDANAIKSEYTVKTAVQHFAN
jgi:uncharacterized protein YkwD